MTKTATCYITLLALLATAPALTFAGKGGKGGGKPPSEEASPPVVYSVTWIPGLGGTRTIAIDVNTSGTVVGLSYDENELAHAIVYTAEFGTIDLNVLLDGSMPAGWRLSSAQRINNAGRIVGHFRDEFGDLRAYVYDETLDPVIQALPVTGSTFTNVHDLSEDGTIVGIVTIDGVQMGFRWAPGVGANVIPEFFTARGVNSFGEILGLTLDQGYGILQPDGTFEPLQDDRADGIADMNDAGILTGRYDGKGSGRNPARYINGNWEVLNKSIGWAFRISEDGQIIGEDWRAPRKGFSTSFVFDPIDGFWTIDDLIDQTDPDSDLLLAGDDSDDELIAEGISDSDPVTGYGVIVGQKWLGADVSPNGVFSVMGFILEPQVIEP